MAVNKPMGPFGPIVTTVAGATLAAERVNNGWVQRQELKLKQNDYKTKNRQIALEYELTSQQKQVEHQKFLMTKTAEKRRIYGDLNSKKITDAQAETLIRDLDEGSNKPLSITRSFHMLEAPLLKSKSKKSTEQKPFIATISYPNLKNKLEVQISKEKNTPSFEEINLDNQEFKLVELEPYPVGEIVCSAIVGGFLGLIFYSVLINIIYRIKIYLDKKK